MRADAAGGATPAAAPAPAARPAFGPALARARAATRPPALGAAALVRCAPGGAARAAARAGAAVLARRRDGAEQGRLALRSRWSEDVAGQPRAAPGADERTAISEPAPGAAAGGAPLLGPTALARVTVEASRLAARPWVQVGLGRELSIRLTRSASGVELVIHSGPGTCAAAAAELPGLVAALRARGVRVASADVRASAARGTVAQGRALTSPRGSATTADQPGGTVAKW